MTLRLVLFRFSAENDNMQHNFGSKSPRPGSVTPWPFCSFQTTTTTTTTVLTYPCQKHGSTAHILSHFQPWVCGKPPFFCNVQKTVFVALPCLLLAPRSAGDRLHQQRLTWPVTQLGRRQATGDAHGELRTEGDEKPKWLLTDCSLSLVRQKLLSTGYWQKLLEFVGCACYLFIC